MKLALGTVQFGLDYGISNTSGQVAPEEVRRVLRDAAAAGISVLDTAAGYGNAEAVLGQILLGVGASFSIVTKTRPLKAASLDEAGLARVAADFEASLVRLGRQSVYALLVHHGGELLLPGGERLYAMLRQWQADGRVGKIGVSVYDRTEIDALFERYALDLVQLPLNVFDQRLLCDGTLAALHRGGVEIHARSVFLQGVLLMDTDALPPFLAPLRSHHADYRAALLAEGVSPLAAAIGFVRQLQEVDVALIGVQSAAQLDQCIAAYNTAGAVDYRVFAGVAPSLVDPRRWH